MGEAQHLREPDCNVCGEAASFSGESVWIEMLDGVRAIANLSRTNFVPKS